MSKTHYAQIELSHESRNYEIVSEKTACGCSTEYVDVVDNWNYVSCKNCIRTHNNESRKKRSI